MTDQDEPEAPVIDADPITRRAVEIAEAHIRHKRAKLPGDAEPRLCRRDRHRGFVQGNVELVSNKAAHLAESYTKAELERRLATGDLVAGYSADEMLRIAVWLIN